jgi:serine/threonine protein kinase
MSSFWNDSLHFSQVNPPLSENETPSPQHARCTNFLEFLGIMFSDAEGSKIGMHPVMTSSSPTFSDVSMGGISFDVRRVKASTFPRGLADEVLKAREFVVVKQPRPTEKGSRHEETLDEIATELQILRHSGIRQHLNIVDFLGLLYHNTGSPTFPRINPTLVLEYAELGNLKSFQANGFGRDIADKFDICHDIAEGLHYLHQCGVIHGDIKDSNMLVCKHKDRSFVVKVSDFGFAISLHDENPRLVGHTHFLEAPEANSPLESKHLVQLDIYSYGLLVYTVMKNGTVFYEGTPQDGRSENIAKMKNSNLLPAALQSNLLLTMEQEKCLILIFCKILAYCLRANPTDRFRDMRDVLDHLKWANPRDLDLSLHREEDLYKVNRWPISFYVDSKDRLLKSFNEQLDRYCDATKREMPLTEMLTDLYRRRMEFEVETMMSKPTLSDTTHYDCCPGLDLVLWRFIFGISPYPPPPKQGPQASSKCVMLAT